MLHFLPHIIIDADFTLTSSYEAYELLTVVILVEDDVFRQS